MKKILFIALGLALCTACAQGKDVRDPVQVHEVSTISDTVLTELPSVNVITIQKMDELDSQIFTIDRVTEVCVVPAFPEIGSAATSILNTATDHAPPLPAETQINKFKFWRYAYAKKMWRSLRPVHFTVG